MNGRALSAARSKLMLAKSGRFTPPIMTRSLQPLSSRAANSFPTSPHLIQVCGKRSISSGASPRIATMCRGSPRATAASASTQESRPRPAMIPSGPVISLASDPRGVALSPVGRYDIVWYAELALRIGIDEINDLLHERICREHAVNILQPFQQRSFACEQHAIGLTQLVDLLARKALTPQSDDVETGQIRSTAESKRHAEGNDVGGNAGHAADESIGDDTHELVHSRLTANDGAVANRDVTAQCHVIHQDHVVANLAVMCHV